MQPLQLLQLVEQQQQLEQERQLRQAQRPVELLLRVREWQLLPQLLPLASTTAISATNSSMNAEGDFFKQTKNISDDSYKATTSKESLENAAIAEQLQ